MTGYEQSGLSRREYCRRRGIAVTTFDCHRLRWNRSSKLAPVTIREAPGAAGAIALILANGRRIEVAGDFAEAVLARLLLVAERT